MTLCRRKLVEHGWKLSVIKICRGVASAPRRAPAADAQPENKEYVQEERLNIINPRVCIILKVKEKILAFNIKYRSILGGFLVDNRCYRHPKGRNLSTNQIKINHFHSRFSIFSLNSILSRGHILLL